MPSQCSACSAVLVEDAKYCHACGNLLDKTVDVIETEMARRRQVKDMIFHAVGRQLRYEFDKGFMIFTEEHGLFPTRFTKVLLVTSGVRGVFPSGWRDIDVVVYWSKYKPAALQFADDYQRQMKRKARIVIDY